MGSYANKNFSSRNGRLGRYAAAMTHSIPRWGTDFLLAIAYAAMFYALFKTANVFWYVPAGLRFAVLLLSPYRRWPWLLAADVLVTLGLYAPYVEAHRAHALLTFCATPLCAAAGPWMVRQFKAPLTLGSPKAMTWLLIGMGMAASGATLGNMFFPFAEAARLSPLQLYLQLELGDYVGMLVLAPLLLFLRYPPSRGNLRYWRLDIPVVLLPALLLYLVLVKSSNDKQVYLFSAMLCLAPGIYFAVRSGWRGAALAVAASSTCVAWSGFSAGNGQLTIEAQGFLAVAGSINLLLGSAYDALRGNQNALQDHNTVLLATRNRLNRLSDDLRDAASRNLNLSEHLRRWITSELHDEIGQNLAALQTRVRLLERKSGMTDSELATDIHQILTTMHRSVSGLMSALRPAGLDEFGLTHALQQGAIRELLETNGLVCAVRIDDSAACLQHLDNDATTTLYRIIQEAATNTVRHANAVHFNICLRARSQPDGLRILLMIDDDGCGFASAHRAVGIGLLGIRDRVLSLGGRLRLRSGEFGTRLQVKLRFAHFQSGTT